LPATNQDVTSQAISVLTLLTAAPQTYTDPDHGAVKGLALVGTTGAGTWQYSLDGIHWPQVGTVSESSARVLPSTAMLRFVPAFGQHGQATLTYRAWDQTLGAAGSLFAVAGTGTAYPFSSLEASVTLTVNPLNEAPSWTASSALLPPLLPGAGPSVAETVVDIFGSAFHDIDGDSVGIAVIGVSGTGWQYSMDGNTWIDIGSVSTSKALLLSGAYLVRFVPTNTFVGVSSLRVLAWDGTAHAAGDSVDVHASSSTGGHTAFSVASFTAHCLVNTAPQLNP
jgi:hypothetical protein